jgi:glucose/arabinose dehydrogenase
MIRSALPPRQILVLWLLAAALAACEGGRTPPVVSEPASSAGASEVAGASPRPTPSVTTEPTPSPTPEPLERLALELVADGLAQPIDVEPRPGDGQLFVAEQVGVIRRVSGGGSEHPVMLDLTDVVNAFSIEQGLLGFAFHPDYPDDPRVFVYHSRADNDNVLASYETTGDPDALDPDSRTELLVIDKEPERMRHNGGTLLFGPDGFLYVSVGDGELGVANAQTPTRLLGKVLRVDVDGGAPYAIPPDNPFADGASGAPEVWWWGLRNPWRISLDPDTGLAYVADVGQERAEEVNVVPLADPGLNFGWPTREGLDAFLDVPLAGDATDPVIEIVHDETDLGCSITGGEVYRGVAIPELAGHYLYADWCHGWIRSFHYADGAALDRHDWSSDLEPGTVSSFGHDLDGELLVLGWDAGTVSRIVPVR